MMEGEKSAAPAPETTDRIPPREWWERAVALGTEAGMDPRAVGAELRRLTGKAGWRELMPEDVDTFRRWLEDAPQEWEPAQPSPSDIEESASAA